MLSQYKQSWHQRFRAAALWVKALVLAGVGAIPMLSSLAPAYAAPAVTERELQTTTTKVSTATTHTWIFDTTDKGGATNVDHIEIEFCETPLGACTVDGTVQGTNNIPILPASPTATLSGPWTSTGNAASRVAGDGGGTGNQILIDKTTADDTNNKNELQISIGGFTNDDTVNTTFYTRMRLYSDTGTTLQWEGVFAQSTAEQLTVNARVQERLDFCVGTTTINDTTTGAPANCAAFTGNTVDIGVVDTGAASISPVAAASGGNDFNGAAMVRTNAFNGAVVDYFAQQETSSGKLKVIGAACVDNVSETDQCFNSAGTTAGTFSVGTERFGMTIGGVNRTSSTAATANLVEDTQYDGDFTAGTTVAWDDTGTVDRIASSAAQAVKVIDDEMLVLRFGAIADVTTPTGQYTVTSTYIATATF